MMKISIFKFAFILTILTLIYSCSPDVQQNEDFNITVRFRSDPAKLNPILGNATVESTELNNLIFLPLGHYDPESLELEPVLAKSLNPSMEITEGPYAGGIAFDYEILEDAVWDDGSPVTGEDYLFTIKLAKNPAVDAAAWRGILQDIVEVDVDKENPKKFRVYLKDYFHLAQEVSCTFEIFPKHVYDPDGMLDNIDLQTLNDAETLSSLMESDSSLVNFANMFSSSKYTQEIVSGSGPYKLKNWEVDQYIVLEKKENYWGAQHNDRFQLRANPKEITYRIIADENAAITLLKDGSIDLMNVMNAENFTNLKESPGFDSMFTIATPPLSRYYYIGLNNRKPELSDRDVRRALAHTFDVDGIIENLEDGYGTRQVTAMMPGYPFYDDSLEPIPFDLEKAKEILVEEGWEDTNGNGVRDKIIDGKLVEMEIDYLASNSPLGQRVGLLFQDNAKQVGVQVNMIIKESRQLSESVYAHEFEASASAAGLSLAPYDPYQRWHSDNSVVGKGNVFGYNNAENDEAINDIRNEPDFEKRAEAYATFQKTMYDEQPVIFLYSPVQKFVLNNKFKGVFSAKRPGYFVNSFEMK